MNSRAQLEKALTSRLNGIQITDQLCRLSRAKAPPPVLKTNSIAPQESFKFLPHPPQNQRTSGLQRQGNARTEGRNVKPVPPAEPRAKKSTVRKFYDVKKQDSFIDEGRISGDGESLENEEYQEKSRCPSWERMPGDGCISDIAEEDEDAEEEDDNIDESDNDDENNDSNEGNLDDEFYECDELDEGKMCFFNPSWNLLFSPVLNNLGLKKSYM